MNANVGSSDKMIRIAVAIILVAAYFLVPLTGVIGYVALAVAAIALVTGLLNFCPLWSAFGINTKKKK